MLQVATASLSISTCCPSFHPFLRISCYTEIAKREISHQFCTLKSFFGNFSIHGPSEGEVFFNVMNLVKNFMIWDHKDIQNTLVVNCPLAPLGLKFRVLSYCS